jgi:hypothetical protein
VLVRGFKLRGTLASKEYFDGEPDPPAIFALAEQASR